MINIFSSDPDRARAEKSAHLDFEIKRLEGKELQLKQDIKQMESEMENSIEVSQNFKDFRFNLIECLKIVTYSGLPPNALTPDYKCLSSFCCLTGRLSSK